MEVSQKTKNTVSIQFCNHTPGHMSRQTIIQRDTCIPVLTAALFIIAKTQNQLKCPLTTNKDVVDIYVQQSITQP